VEYLGIVVVVAAILAALAFAPVPGQLTGGIGDVICKVVGGAGCGASAEATAAQGADGAGSPDPGSGGTGAGADAASCSGFWGCAWEGVTQVGSGVYNVGKGAVDDVVGIVDLVTDPSQLLDALGYVWDHPGDAAKQMVWDDDSSTMWGDGDYGGAIGRTVWNVGSWFIPGYDVAKAGSKFGVLARLGSLADEAAALAKRAAQAARLGDLRVAREAAEAARRYADDAAEAARRAGCPLALGGGGGPGRFGATALILAGGGCDDLAAAARAADEAADRAEAAVRAADGTADTVTAVNRAGQAYPNVLDPRTGQPIPYPGPDLTKVPPAQRVTWTATDRAAFIKAWYDRGYPTPPGGWSDYDIHHIRPREYGGSNDFDNLVPVPRTVHQQQLNPWWQGY
jgi:hypothetical protein